MIPFLGNCAITRAMRWPARILVNDLDPQVVQKWQAAGLGPQLEVHHGPALDFLRATLQHPGLGRVVVYADPPYPHSTPTSTNRYQCEMTDAQHRDLLDALRWLRVDCLLSTYPNDLYRQQLTTWNLTEFQSITRSGPRTEWLLYNYSLPQVLHDDSFSGENYRQREYTKRKASRWVARYRQMPAHEQQRILGQILQYTPTELVQQLTRINL